MFKKIIIFVFLISLFVLGIPNIFQIAKAATLITGSVTLSDSTINTSGVTYTIQFSGVSLSLIKCIKVQFSNAVTAGSKPAGMTITSLALSGTSNYVPAPASWSPANTDATGVSLITFGTGATPASASSRTVVLTGITNGNTANTGYFIQFSTYNNVDCSTTPVDNGVISYIFTNAQIVTGTVDPTLSFSIAGVSSGGTVNGATTNVTSTTTTIPFGTITSSANKIAAQDLVIATNAGGGYTVTVDYSGTFTSTGGATIADWTGTNASPTTFSAAGTAAFGYTTADATLGTGTTGRFSGNKWAAFTTSPLEVAYNGAPISETIRVGYQVGISAVTPAGAYTTTVTFIATPIY